MATAQINFIRIDHNVWMRGENGMLVHVGFDVENFAGQDGQAVAYFNYWQGGPLKAFGDNPNYKTIDGHVAVSENFSPAFEAANYGDLPLFMPYSELHMAPAPGTAALMCMVRIWDNSAIVPISLASSAWIQFLYSQE